MTNFFLKFPLRQLQFMHVFTQILDCDRQFRDISLSLNENALENTSRQHNSLNISCHNYRFSRRRLFHGWKICSCLSIHVTQRGKSRYAIFLWKRLIWKWDDIIWLNNERKKRQSRRERSLVSREALHA